MSRFTVVLDACVLYPAPLRDALMRLALTDLFKAHWTDQRIPDPRSTNQRINESTNQRSTIHDPRSIIVRNELTEREESCYGCCSKRRQR